MEEHYSVDGIGGEWFAFGVSISVHRNRIADAWVITLTKGERASTGVGVATLDGVTVEALGGGGFVCKRS